MVAFTISVFMSGLFFGACIGMSIDKYLRVIRRAAMNRVIVRAALATKETQ